MQEDIYKTLREKRRDFYKSLPRALLFRDPEDVHKTRVAGRTLLALLDMAADENDQADPRFRKMRRALKRSMGMLGEIRDADVMIEEIEKRLPSMTRAQQDILCGLIEEERASRQKLRRTATRKLPQIIDRDWKKRMAAWQRAKASSPQDDARFRARLSQLRKARKEAIQAIRDTLPGPLCIDNVELLDRLHRGRIATKKLRYALETISAITGEDDAEIRHLKVVQDQLGHIQDLRVWSLKLRAYGGSGRTISRILNAWQAEMEETLRQTDLEAAGSAG